MVDIVEMVEKLGEEKCEAALQYTARKYAEELVEEIKKAKEPEDFDMAFDIADEVQSMVEILWRVKRGRLEIKASEAERKLLTSHKPSDKIKV